MDRTKKYLITAFISVLIIVALISFLGMILLGNKPKYVYPGNYRDGSIHS